MTRQYNEAEINILDYQRTVSQQYDKTMPKYRHLIASAQRPNNTIHEAETKTFDGPHVALLRSKMIHDFREKGSLPTRQRRGVFPFIERRRQSDLVRASRRIQSTKGTLLMRFSLVSSSLLTFWGTSCQRFALATGRGRRSNPVDTGHKQMTRNCNFQISCGLAYLVKIGHAGSHI